MRWHQRCGSDVALDYWKIDEKLRRFIQKSVLSRPCQTHDLNCRPILFSPEYLANGILAGPNLVGESFVHNGNFRRSVRIGFGKFPVLDDVNADGAEIIGLNLVMERGFRARLILRTARLW